MASRTQRRVAQNMASAGIRERLTDWLSKVSTHDPSALHWARGVLLLAGMLVPLVFFWAYGHEVYVVSALIGAVFSLVTDPGRAYGQRVIRMILFGLFGAGVTALGFWMGGKAWGWLVLVTFAVRSEERRVGEGGRGGGW